MLRNAMKSFLGILVVVMFSVVLFAQAKTEKAADTKQPAAQEKAVDKQDKKEPNPADNYSEADRPEYKYL
jgi:Ca2+/H+ antiporter